MAIRAQITCIRKSNHSDPYQRITDIGGPNPNGKQWGLEVQEAIAGYKANTYTFFVRVGDQEVEVRPRDRSPRPYLATAPDFTLQDNLLSLPECA